MIRKNEFSVKPVYVRNVDDEELKFFRQAADKLVMIIVIRSSGSKAAKLIYHLNDGESHIVVYTGSQSKEDIFLAKVKELKDAAKKAAEEQQ